MSEEKIRIPIERRLKDCPFCGGKAVLNHGHMITATGQYLANVKCSECGVASKVVWSTDSPEEAVKEAIEAWNRRVVTDTNDGSKERTAKVEILEMKNTHNKVWKCSNCGQYMHRANWSREVKYCSHCGCRLDWSE